MKQHEAYIPSLSRLKPVASLSARSTSALLPTSMGNQQRDAYNTVVQSPSSPDPHE